MLLLIDKNKVAITAFQTRFSPNKKYFKYSNVGTELHMLYN